MSLDVLTLAAAKKYTDSQRLGYTETVKKTITWDGNTEGKLAIPAENMLAYKVSDTPIKITQDNIKRIRFSNDSVKIDGYVVQSQTAENGATMSAVIGIMGMVTGQLAAVAYDDIYVDGDLIIEKGVYFGMGYNGKDYISILETEEEVIHKVDPKYLPEGGVGHEEKKVVTWDGNTEGKHGINMGQFTLAKASDVPINVTAENLKRMVFTVTDRNDTRVENIDLSKLDVFISPDGNNITIIQSEGVEAPLAMIFPETVEQMGEKGVYLLDIDLSDAFGDGAHQYVSLLETETVHQIDKKYIPGVTLSEVTITEIQEFNSEENYPLSAETSAVLDALLEKKKPIIVTIKLEFQGTPVVISDVAQVCTIPGISGFVTKGMVTIGVFKQDGAWEAFAETDA